MSDSILVIFCGLACAGLIFWSAWPTIKRIRFRRLIILKPPSVKPRKVYLNDTLSLMHFLKGYSQFGKGELSQFEKVTLDILIHEVLDCKDMESIKVLLDTWIEELEAAWRMK